MIKKHLEQIKNDIGPDIKLCAVTKKRSLEEISSLYDVGERLFAENRADELIRKAKTLPSDIEWHYIGHLQKNKVRMVLPYISCIQSLDSIALAKLINKEAERIQKKIPVLCELHLAEEDTNKTGLTIQEADQLIEVCQDLEYIDVQGIMAMGPHTDDTKRIEGVFTQAQSYFQTLQDTYGKEKIHTLSMGMSQDYQIALTCGTTMVRIGTYLFEEE